MAYSLAITQPVKDYLRSVTGLSRDGRLRMFTLLHDSLRDHGDFFRADPALRLALGSSLFWLDLAFVDPGDGRVHLVRFVVDDSAAAYGVLRAVYADYYPPPTP